MKRYEAIEHLKMDLFGEKTEIKINYIEGLKSIKSINPEEVSNEIDKIQIIYNSLKHVSEIFQKMESIDFKPEFYEQVGLSQSTDIVDEITRICVYSHDANNIDDFNSLLEKTKSNLNMLEERYDWLTEEVIY